MNADIFVTFFRTNMEVNHRNSRHINITERLSTVQLTAGILSVDCSQRSNNKESFDFVCCRLGWASCLDFMRGFFMAFTFSPMRLLIVIPIDSGACAVLLTMSGYLQTLHRLRTSRFPPRRRRPFTGYKHYSEMNKNLVFIIHRLLYTGLAVTNNYNLCRLFVNTLHPHV